MSDDQDRVMKILEKHEHLDFVQRILSPEKYPVISDHPKLEKGYIATHQMAQSENEDGTEFYVYPNIVREGNHLNWLEDEDAYNYAESTGERITFDKREDAEWFSKNYKSVWPEWASY